MIRVCVTVCLFLKEGAMCPRSLLLSVVLGVCFVEFVAFEVCLVCV